MQLRYLIFFLVCLLTLISTTQAQKIFYVTPTGSSAPASATTLQAAPSWASSTTDLQGAINAATSGDQVWVATGTYKPGGNANTNRSISFAMKNGVAIYGGFKGDGTETQLSARPAINPVGGQPSSSTLSGDIGDPNSTTDNSYHVISNPAGLTTTALLDGFVITGGNANGSGNDAVGGGISNNGSGTGQVCSPSVQNCLLVSNAANIGAGIYNNGSNGGNSSPLLLNCLFQNNTAGQFGGGIQNNAATNGSTLPRLVNCGFVSNQATQSGGAMSNDGQVGGNSSPLLVNCSLLANTAPTGGAMLSFGASGTCNPRLTNGVVWNNGGGAGPPGNTFNTVSATVTASYSLFDAASFLSDPTNLTTATSPFASALSVDLDACSPALNVGSNASYTAAVGTPPSTDLAGQPRIYPTGGTIDLGAVEFQASASAPPARLYVAASQTAVNGGDGLSWATAFRDLQRALTYPCSQSLTEIWVAGGVYKPTSTTARTISFAMLPGVAIIGGFVGSETALSGRPAIDPVSGNPSSSTLSGEIGDPNSTTDNSLHVISNPVSLSLTTTAVLDGFVITAGNANGSGNDGLGGGIFNNGSSPALSNCSFLSNRATNGGAINNLFRSSPALSNCSFLSNTAINGGAIVCENSSNPTLSNCSFLSNTAARGGGIYNQNNSKPMLSNCSFLSNVASPFGGAIFSLNSSPTLTNCTLQSNQGEYGGAMYNDGRSGDQARPVLTNCVLQNNQAYQGGAMYNWVANGGQASPVLTNCTLQSNSATAGGAMYNNGNGGQSSPVLTNCTLQGNSASSQGGAMVNIGSVFGQSSPVLTNCALQSNTAQSGGAMFNDGRNGQSSPVLTNCVLWNNGSGVPGAGSTFVNLAASLSATFSLFEPSSLTTGVNVSGPGNLTNVTTSPFVSATSVALNACSPAINAGDPASVTVANGPYSATALPQTDLTNQPRIVGNRVDMGAVEFNGTQQFPLSVTLAPASGSVVCAGSAVTVPVGVTGTVTAYQWYKDGVSLGSSQTAATLSLSNVQVADAGSYSVVVTGGCNSLTSTAFSLTINALPTSPALTGGTLICAQTSVTLTATAGGATAFTLLGGSGPQSNNTGLFAVSTPAAYTALLATTNGCTVSTTATLSQDVALPSLTLTPASATLTCQNPSLTLTASSLANSASFAFGGGGTRLGSNQLQVMQGGTYSVTVTAPNGCTNTAQALISQDVNVPTGLNLSASNSGVLNCTATSLTLTASATGNSLTFVLSGPGGTRNGPVQLVNLPGTYSVVVTAGNGCSAATTTSLSSDTAIQATLTASNTALCSGASALLTAGDGAGLPGSTYRFTGPGGLLQSGLTNTLSATQTGLYAVTVTAGNGCTASQTLSLTIAPAPNAQLTFLNGGAVVQVTGGVSYFFVQPLERINGYETRETTSSRDGFFNLKRPGPFWVLVTGANGCSARVDGVSARP